MKLILDANMGSISELVSANPSFGDGSGSPLTSSVSSVALANRGNVWRFVGVGSSANCAIWPLAAPLDVDPLVRELLIELEVAQSTPGAGGYFGISLIDRVGTIHAYNHFAFGAAEWASRIDNGSRVTAGGTGTGGGESGLARFRITGRVQASLPPLIKSYLDVRGVGEIRGSGATADNDSPARPFSAGTVEGSSWNGLALASIGLVMQSSGGNALPSQVDVLALRVFDPLADGGGDAPTVAYVTPIGSEVEPDDAIVVDITHDDGVGDVVVLAKFSGTWPTVHDGVSFAPDFVLSTRDAIANGWRYTIRYTSGWPRFLTDASFQIVVKGVASGVAVS